MYKIKYQHETEKERKKSINIRKIDGRRIIGIKEIKKGSKGREGKGRKIREEGRKTRHLCNLFSS